jgi:hypothetical protein
LALDKKHREGIDSYASEVVQALESQKEFDKIYEESKYKEQFDSLEYCDREEDEELKALFVKEQEKFDKLSESLYGKIDGEIDMDLHGNISFRAPGVKGG